MRAPFPGSRIFLESLGSKLFHDESVGEFGLGRASVAVIFKFDESAKILLIKRAVKEGDPWSGQIAFPGGRVERGDSSFRDTAIRETREEVGIDLRRNSRFLGYLGLFKARTRGMMVVPSVFTLTGETRISPNREVASHRWVPINIFGTDSNRSIYSRDRDGMKISFPSYVVGDYVIWGLTERIISTLTGYLY
jgi:8-oxo-dGTP pyrophosphatase MutT (NUDIX family)